MESMVKLFKSTQKVKLNEGLLSDKEEYLLELLDHIRSMETELYDTKNEIEKYLDDMKNMPINHGLGLSDEFETARIGYNQIIKEMI